eukprot:scaffold292330_cov49-Prasinocladus_malaysianus.AAC.1
MPLLLLAGECLAVGLPAHRLVVGLPRFTRGSFCGFNGVPTPAIEMIQFVSLAFRGQAKLAGFNGNGAAV